MTKSGRNTLYSLRDDTSIIIKVADKGSGAVVWDREDYLAEVKKQVNDEKVYQKLREMLKAQLKK